jgi:Protein of unknown function (DUF4199)
MPRMKSTVLTWGLISGGIASAMLLLTVPFQERIGFEHAETIGYTLIVASLLPVYFGIRSYREQAGGSLTFGRAFTVGLLITLLSCVCYVITWEIVYFTLAPGFAEKYAAYAIEQAKQSGASQAQLDETARQMRQFKELYDKPLFNAAITFLEPFPIGLIVTTVSAGVLRKRKEPRAV